MNDSRSVPSFSIGINDLQEHWRRLHALEEGELIGVIDLTQMPPWKVICGQLHWQTYELGGGYFSAKHHGFCGVYRLIALETPHDLSKPAKLARVGGEDDSGTLYLGEASDLSLRLNQMRRTARSYRSERSHGAINMLRQLRALDFPEEKLGVALMFTGRHTRSVERDLLHAYINSFGEMPPLNYRL
ncbi:hypothetical protein [Bradyrhizobium stylosanthis]|uniref:hypothetical protein n=1 Tax=Bradyrhizobium stylosanthis TaxID=1803665 RepID=UPI0012E7F53D|nr:hypothetical protein [Bradyrhizobium stylosanthis]